MNFIMAHWPWFVGGTILAIFLIWITKGKIVETLFDCIGDIFDAIN